MLAMIPAYSEDESHVKRRSPSTDRRGGGHSPVRDVYDRKLRFFGNKLRSDSLEKDNYDAGDGGNIKDAGDQRADGWTTSKRQRAGTGGAVGSLLLQDRRSRPRLGGIRWTRRKAFCLYFVFRFVLFVVFKKNYNCYSRGWLQTKKWLIQVSQTWKNETE